MEGDRAGLRSVILTMTPQERISLWSALSTITTAIMDTEGYEHV